MKRFLLLCSALFVFAVAKAQDDSLPEVKHITKEEFLEKVYDYEKNPDKWVFKGDKPCIFIFHATWCPPCRETLPNLELINFDYGDKIDIYQINVDMQYELALHFKLQNIPTIYTCPKDGSEPRVFIQVMTYENFVDVIESDLLK
ncbi:MAG: thioredoxin domain-containing protein [Rikenellaceae bacterium]